MALQLSPRSFHWLGVCATALSVLCPSLAVEAAKMKFDVPADVVARAIKTFAQQSNVEILIRAELGREIRTQPVKGEFSLREAIDRMLRGTGLVANQDEKTGVVTIVAAASANGQNAAADPPADPQSSIKKKAITSDGTSKIMRPRNTNKIVTLFASLIGLAAASDPLLGQAVVPTTRERSALEADSLVELSPFIVSSERDSGYQATSTLAGTRLNTPLKDLGAAISVYTKDFIDDLGVTNANDLMVYATNMEAAGPSGNFSGATNDIHSVTVVGDNIRVDPQSGLRTRGLARPSVTRGLFLSGIGIDSYNTARVTVNRGPNAALFGVGNPAGVVDHTLLLPDLHRNTNSVEMRYGTNDSLRGSVDFNRVLIDKKLAARIAAVHDREEYNQRPAFEEKKRIYGALTFEPFKSTSLHASFESGNTLANRPITILPFKSISDQWFADGRPSNDWTYYDDPVRNPSAATQNAGGFWGFHNGAGQIFDQIVEFYDQPNATAAARALRSRLGTQGGNPPNNIHPLLFHPLLNRDRSADLIATPTGTQNIFDYSGGFWTGANVLPGQQPGLPPTGIKNQGFTDSSAFDWKNRMIDETSRQGDSFHAFNIALEQRAWKDRVGVEVAYATERVDRRGKNSFFQNGNNNHIRLDTGAVLNTGEPNPNLGRPFTVFNWSTWSTASTGRETSRVTGYLKYDFSDLSPSWGKWFGRHTVTGLYENYAIELMNYQTRLAADGPGARAFNPLIEAGPRKIGKLVYLGPSIIGNNNPLQLQPIQIPPAAAGPASVPLTSFNRQGDATDLGSFEDGPLSYVEINAGGNASREVIKSKAAVLQSYWLQDHLITLLGWRRDVDYSTNTNIAFVSNPADRNDPGKVHYSLDDFAFPHTPPRTVAKEIFSYGVVLNWPRKLVKLPKGTDFSVFYNQSENFTPLGTRRNNYGEPLDSPQGTTKDYGFGFSALGNRLTIRVNRYETAIKDDTFNPQVYGLAIRNAMFQVPQTWLVEGNVNPHLVEMRNAQVDFLFSALPANYRELYGLKVEGEAPKLVSRYEAISSVDTTDYVAKGTEMEIVFNPTRNWRIMANVSKQETVQTNMLPSLKQFVALMLPIWNQLRGVPVGGYPLGWQVGDPLPAGMDTYGDFLDRSILVPYATVLATEGSASAEQRKWRGNLVTNYTFDGGSLFGFKLHGWGVGGAVRWQDKVGIGYPTTRNPDSSVNIDIANPWYAPAETNVDAWVSYKRKLWNDRIHWTIKFNVRNLYADTDPIAIGVQPWGEISTARLAPERRWYLTNTFNF